MPRARDLGIPFEGVPGPTNSIIDVAGVEVGHETIIQPDGPARTGVTVVLPRGKRYSPVFAGMDAYNGCGEMTGSHWVDESGFLESGIFLTSSFSVGVVRDAALRWALEHILVPPDRIRDVFWGLPVVGETNDFDLNSKSGFHIRDHHVFAALDGASQAPPAEGSVGGGTGMVCYQFKGGIGTSSRTFHLGGGDYTLGALVQANHGARQFLTLGGIPMGGELTDLMPGPGDAAGEPGSGSIIIVLATDAPLLPRQLKRLARRVPAGLGRNGACGDNGSGEFAIAFSTHPPRCAPGELLQEASFLPNAAMSMLFYAAAWAVEEAVVNALTSAGTMTGFDGYTVHGLPHRRVQEILKRHNRLLKP